MPVELISKFFFSLFDLLRGAFFLAIPVFLVVFLSSFLHSWLAKKYNFSWLKSTMVTSYLTIFILIMVLYSVPAFLGFQESDQGTIPLSFQLSTIDWLVFIALIVLRNAAISLLFTLFILPLEFLSSMVFDYLKEKTKINKWLGVFAAVFSACLAASIILLFLFPWVIGGIVYLTFYWHL
jgi:hypothetical protein